MPTTRVGSLSAYYFVDDYSLDNPYPGGQGGASVPGFDAISSGRAQEFSAGDTKIFGANTVNEFRVGFLRNANDHRPAARRPGSDSCSRRAL